jgi:uncharacterized membrane protein
MTWYQVGLAVHALVAVLGVGQIVAIAVLASDARAGSDRLPATLAVVARLARIMGISFGFMLLSGIGLMIPTHGAFGAQWWFRISFVLFLVLGFFHGQLMRALRAAGGPASEGSTRAVSRMRSVAWTMCGLVAVIVMLMAAKPF